MKTKKFTGDRIFDFVNVTVIRLMTIIILVRHWRREDLFSSRKNGL